MYISPMHTKKELARHNQQAPQTASSYNTDNNLFVRPIPSDVNEEEVKRVFSQFGEVRSVLIRGMRDQPTLRKGYVLFANSSEAFAAIRALDSQILWNVRVSVRLFESA